MNVDPDVGHRTGGQGPILSPKRLGTQKVKCHYLNTKHTHVFHSEKELKVNEKQQSNFRQGKKDLPS